MVPLTLTTYVPSPDTITVVALQFGETCPVAQSFTEDAGMVAAGSVVSAWEPALPGSVVSTAIVCAVFHGPLDVSATAVSAAGGLMVGITEALAQVETGAGVGSHVPAIVLHT
jgi:hypothetical protein